MKKSLLILLSSGFAFSAFAQDNLKNEAKRIVDEGKQLYRTEIGTRTGTTVFNEKYKGKEKMSGIVSYVQPDGIKSVVYTKGEKFKALATITFDTMLDAKKAQIDFLVRDLTTNEMDLIALKASAMSTVEGDPSFTKAEGTKFIFIPLIAAGQKSVYLLNASEKQGHVIFGNDCILSFDSKNKFTSKKVIHPNTIIVKYGIQSEAGADPNGASHIHYPETGDLMTSTDVCILMLNEKLASWKQHTVISENFVSFYDCRTDMLLPIPKTGDGKDYIKK